MLVAERPLAPFRLSPWRCKRCGLALAVALTVGLAVFADGGFGDTSRATFAGMSGLALLIAARTDAVAAMAAGRSAIVAATAALALLSALSAFWTVAEPAEAVRWSLVLAGYAALIVSSAVVAQNSSGALILITAVIAIVALFAGLLGLWGAATGHNPLGERIGGTWRPAGPFEYPPALALLSVTAMPIYIDAMTRFRLSIAAIAAVGAAVGALVIALSQSRLEVGLALGMVAWLLAPTSGRRVRVLGIAILGVAAAAGYALAGGVTSGDSRGVADALPLAAVILATVLVWCGVRSKPFMEANSRRKASASRFRVHSFTTAQASIAIVVVLGVAAAATIASTKEGAGIQPSSGLAHGRANEWHAALVVGAEHPLTGTGAESYLEASRYEQGKDPVLYAHSLPLEAFAGLGVPGLLCVLGIYAGGARLVWRERNDAAGRLLGPGILAFLVANLADWSWHLAGAGAIWAVAAGGLIGCSVKRPGPNPSAASCVTVR